MTFEAENENILAFVSGITEPDTSVQADAGDFVRLSVVVPSYNQARYLEKTLLSIINQHYPNTEIIVLDGGSTDGSQAIIEKYRRFIHVVKIGEDDGQADAINKGFAIATGDFVAWQNSDDLYLPGYFHHVNSVIRQDREIDFVVSNYYAIDEHDHVLYRTHLGPFIVDALISHDWNMGSQTAFVRRDLAGRAGPMPLFPVAFDWYWFVRVGQNSAKTAVLKRYGGCYRLHEDAKLRAFDLEKRRGFEEKARVMLGINGSPGSVAGAWLSIKRFFYWRLKILNRRLLYPRPDRIVRIDRAWAVMWGRLGYTLIGFG